MTRRETPRARPGILLIAALTALAALSALLAGCGQPGTEATPTHPPGHDAPQPPTGTLTPQPPAGDSASQPPAGDSASRPPAGDPASRPPAGASALGEPAPGRSATGGSASGGSALGLPPSAQVPQTGPGGPLTRLPRGTALRIMPLGDSITEGARSSDGGGYRTHLYGILARAGVPVDFVGSRRGGSGPDIDHEGHSGWAIAELTHQIDGWLTTYRPDVVLLHAGTNDMNSDISASRAPERLATLIRHISRNLPQADVYVAEIIGTRKVDNGAVLQRRADGFNARIPQVVAAAGRHVHLVDQHAIRDALIADKLHPNDAGYAAMAANWGRALLKF